MDVPEAGQVAEIALSPRYSQAHGWVVTAVRGWLSAYYMEEPRFQVCRSYQEPETGIHVWVCESAGPASVRRLLRRLQADVPPFQVHQQVNPADGSVRYYLDVPPDEG